MQKDSKKLHLSKKTAKAAKKADHAASKDDAKAAKQASHDGKKEAH